MNRHRNQFHHHEEEESHAADTDARGQHGPDPMEFSSPEEMLRYDAARTKVPPEIALRLRESAAPLPAPRRPWWKRLWNRA